MKESIAVVVTLLNHPSYWTFKRGNCFQVCQPFPILLPNGGIKVIGVLETGKQTSDGVELEEDTESYIKGDPVSSEELTLKLRNFTPLPTTFFLTLCDEMEQSVRSELLKN